VANSVIIIGKLIRRFGVSLLSCKKQNNLENNTSEPKPTNGPPFYKRSAFFYLLVACIALLVTGIAAMFHKNYPGVKLKDFAAELINNDIPPGGSRAFLTIASEETIILNEVADGKLGEEEGVIFRKTGNGQLAYQVNDAEEQSDGIHIITTPKGGTYQITLPDGSKVWLNAASTLKFPLNFSSTKERKIELSGEAYLEVVKDAKHPFKVRTDHQLLQVLGTDFNICNYIDDRIAKTTVLEGSLRLRAFGDNVSSPDEVLLKAGEQATLSRGVVSVIKADTAAAMAWKNGLFIFHNEPLDNIMKRVSRWYDVDVVYQDVDPRKTFDVRVSRFEHVSKVLNLLELSGRVHFKMEPGKIIVMK